MPSYKNDPPDQEYLDSIKKHTDKETNKVNLALVAKDFGYASGKSFQKKYAKLKKAHNLTNGHIYGDDKPETSSTEAASPKVAQPPPKPKLKETKTLEAEKDDMDIVSENLKTHSDKIATEKRGKSSEDDKKKKMQA
ncbi:uncharacterized protein N7525_004179 [Penicillium rubens]|uniref:uncharacterized protein n=1 Tax=Penicillium rubens TaxID=1108849 RepID=UPI002A5AB513|nr:uncharacterized protein N7525_004179 [Penicillium rubens]KAJ5838991.1 hypothetical protein N7525_004179 [Penicillium rubens]KAJ5867044.1 hypothetical protein N7534_001597 [Penicillium rubens]